MCIYIYIYIYIHTYIHTHDARAQDSAASICGLPRCADSLMIWSIYNNMNNSNNNSNDNNNDNNNNNNVTNCNILK